MFNHYRLLLRLLNLFLILSRILGFFVRCGPHKCHVPWILDGRARVPTAQVLFRWCRRDWQTDSLLLLYSDSLTHETVAKVRDWVYLFFNIFASESETYKGKLSLLLEVRTTRIELCPAHYITPTSPPPIQDFITYFLKKTRDRSISRCPLSCRVPPSRLHAWPPLHRRSPASSPATPKPLCSTTVSRRSHPSMGVAIAEASPARGTLAS